MGADSIQSAMRHKIQGRIDRMEKVEQPPDDSASVRAAIDGGGAGRVGRDVIRSEGLAKRYGGRTLFSGLDLLVERGDRVGLVGPNGAGKTTLVKLILGVEQPSEGWLTLGHNVRLAYFSQHAADSLDVERTVIESLTDIADMTETQARNYLARFLFCGDDVFKKVSMLSGGEKNKLALARMIVEPCNLLILDEPTNHLDIRSADALTSMLRRYESTLLLVSHDRYLLNSTTTKTLALSGDGRAEVFDGPYSAWREAERARELVPLPAKSTSKISRAKAVPPPPRPMNAYELSKARVKARDVLAAAEATVHAMETRLAEIEAKLARPADGISDLVALAAEHTRLQDDLGAALSQWERAAGEADTLGA
jgi:ATP-binding cassette subfamily F protein 3